MATNLNIDVNLLEEAYILCGLKTKREAVNLALQEFIQRHKQKELLKFINKVDFDENYDYKKERSRK
ncbi:MAG: type II toxin-antitoxin system VapB family antitoxin [Bacteroidales bacterium]|nr:type II toxin-antitoxin system VapB family antitoxin [Bacteroidales bacterium]